MPRFSKLLLLLLVTAFTLLPRPADALLIPRYDLQSLCYMSTDIVEAILSRHHVTGQSEGEDTWTAIVLHTLEGQYKTGEKIGSFNLFLYEPNATGQHCILFIARRVTV